MRSRYTEPEGLVATAPPPRLGGPTFALRYRVARLGWSLAWLLLASWTPHQFQPLRRLLLAAFGADIHPSAMVRGSARIWWPGNLRMGEHASMGPGVVCYNVAPIEIGAHAIVSQRAHLCTGTHDIDDPGFPLVARPIRIGEHAWIAAEAFVGPGVTVGRGAVLGARGAAFRDLDEWTVYGGNPSRAIRGRQRDIAR